MVAGASAQEPPRLSVRYQGTATLSVSGDIPEFGFGPSTLTYGWHICGGSGSCDLEYSWTNLGFTARWGAGGGYSFSSNINLLTQRFIFDFNPPTFSAQGYSYSYKHDLGFLYFAQPISVGSSGLLTAASCSPNDNPPPDCCSSAHGTLDFSVSLRTSVGSAAIGDSRSSSCSAGEDCARRNTVEEWPTPSANKRGYRSASLIFEQQRDSKAHNEKVEVSLQLKASGTRCGSGAGGGTVGGGACTGIVLQSAPDPLGVSAIGENEYVWSSTTPAELEIDAAAMVHTWGCDSPDTAWLASEVSFSTEPEIPTDYTKPGILTVARGSLLVAQSLVDGNMQDKLVYKLDRLPPKNSDFGKKKVVFASRQGKVDYAEVEVFYPADATNHPGSLRGVLLVLLDEDECTPYGEVEVPNWFYYYSQVYPASDATYALAIRNAYGLTCRQNIYLSQLVSTKYGEMEVFLFRNVDGEIIAVEDETLWIRGIHKFVVVLEHERVHKRLCERGVDRVCNRDITDNDGDGIDD
jgi:hypothetical protein